ncbi:MAG: VanZ family protein [Woeseiaceae bacterium]|nr:VanZ family protein [Woeseiaceae bacterium]
MMLPLRYLTQWRIAGLALLGAVFLAALVPSSLLWPGGLPISQWTQGDDKLVHAVTFAIMTTWFGGQYAQQGFWKILLGLALFGVLIEICQGVVGYRTRDAIDVAANLVGILVGYVIVRFWLAGWSARTESWFDRQFGRRSVD